MAEYGKFSSQFHAANYWLLGRRNLVGIEIAVCGEGNAVIGLESGGTIFKVNKVNELAAEKVRRGSRSLRHNPLIIIKK